MRVSTDALHALALMLLLTAPARGEDEPVTPADAEADGGFPWLCFVTTVAALGGLYVFVRRRERTVEADERRRRGRLVDWYCRACDRDVTGRACPHCGTANPFGHEPPATSPPRDVGRRWTPSGE